MKNKSAVNLNKIGIKNVAFTVNEGCIKERKSEVNVDGINSYLKLTGKGLIKNISLPSLFEVRILQDILLYCKVVSQGNFPTCL